VCLAIPGKLLQKSEVNGVSQGRIEFGGIIREACLDFLPEAEVGDYVLVHVGFAISKIDEDDALQTLAYLRQLGTLEEELGILPQHTAENSPSPSQGLFVPPPSRSIQ